MNDEKLIDIIANVWISGGGDRDGLIYCFQKIIDRVHELVEENKIHRGENDS